MATPSPYELCKMGCGPSSSANVAEEAVTIEQKRPSSRDFAQEETEAESEPTAREDRPVPKDTTPSENAGEVALNVIKTDAEPTKNTSTAGNSNSSNEEEKSHDIVTSSSKEAPPTETTPSRGTEKGTTFDVPFSEGASASSKRPPRRLDSKPLSPLTSEELEQKQRVAEENRRKEMDRRAGGGQRLSRKERLRREILEARETNKQQELVEGIERKLSAGSEKRGKMMGERVEKIKKREEHAKKLKGRVLEASESESYEDNLEIETDVCYNAEEDDADTWNT